ncbi:anhydro-N-acetylmuramic acid kinase [Rhodocytophaga aerolata]|uniref:Anhydro-N-acetylmuramic acid kinase n=1 Tax=Rhodocytophaga aerolata TaxID=455078 RepID=A0ABT8R5C9_9BACT|nr:anhydro-N-acetylmuramic acid kinase [Rhodocytophaga aerolata]MDO1447305.1 anhydro-N-acetylmuramic acid kinase [Rhodocytophaga aerolata]
MNPNIHRLYEIAQKQQRLIIGLMSGTSLDGLDVALCRFTGSGLFTELQVVEFETVPYTEDIKNEIRPVFSTKIGDIQRLCLLNAWIGSLHASMIQDCLKKWNVAPEQVDLIASHGQTIYHAPKHLHNLAQFPNATLQIGDGDHIAVKTGIITFSDFRQKHIAAGGEGAPLAVYGDYILFSKKGEDRIMLNMGGIANFTYLPGDLDASRMFSTDVGTGNTLLDAFTRLHFNKPYDENGTIAASGKVHTGLLAALQDNPFFKASFPKTTGPELFNMDYVKTAQQQSDSQQVPPQDIMATLARFTAEGIANAIHSCFTNTKPILYASGGGMHNPVIMQMLQTLLPGYVFKDTSALAVSPDAKEAVLFAILANESVAGESIALQSRGVPSVYMGKVSFPQ